MSHFTFTDEQLREAIQRSTSIRQVLLSLNLAAKGGNYKTLYRAVERLGLDISHFKGQGHAKGKTFEDRHVEAADYIKSASGVLSYLLKKKLLRQGVFEPLCDRCKGIEWQGEAIPLELDHIDGNHSNNDLDNLRLLCPNCHALTPTYRGRNKKRA